MPRASVKIAVSLPRGVYHAMEAIRRRRKTTRSALVAEAIQQWLSARERAEDVRRYTEAYTQMPETSDEVAAAERLSALAFTSEEWS